MTKYFLLFLLLLSFSSYAQTPQWAFNIGNSGTDGGYSCKVAPNGNVYVTGRFSGTIDIDPGSGVHNITSNGLTDIFLGCYTPAGAYIWGFGIGSAGYDGGNALAVDAASNVIVVGFFQGTADFDPGTGVTMISYAGGSGLTYEGDGFAAKYSSSGAFQWAKGLGGSTVYDFAYAAATDDLGNVYIGGEYYGSLVVSPSITFSGSNGCGYIIKYSPTGTVIWAHNYGAANVDAATLTMVIRSGFIYATGAFRGTADLYPWGTHMIFSALAGPGGLDAFVAKYDLDGNMVFAKQIGGSGVDNFTYGGLTLDAAGDIYVAGYTKSTSITFDMAAPGSSTYTAPGGGGSNFDILVAKYSNTGNYQWGMLLGGPGDDYAHYVDVSDGYLYVTGDFKNTVDMDPSGAVANLVSSGGSDMFLTKYDLSRNYLCGFRVGTAGIDDGGGGLCNDGAGYLYTTGRFGGPSTDFDPGTATYPLTGNGATDAYLAKYSYTAGSSYTGNLTGETICAGQPAHLTLNITSGASGPYNVTYTNGTSSFTATGVMSGVPFLISPSPLVTTTYTITSIVYTGAVSCSPPTVTVGTPATITVSTIPGVTPAVTVNCNTINLSAPAGYASYQWAFGDGGTSLLNPAYHVYGAGGIYTLSLTVTNTSGCTASTTFVQTISGSLSVNLGPDTAICPGQSGLLHANGVYTSPVYLWSTGSNTATITPSAPGTYWLRITSGSCAGTDTIVVTNRPAPVVNLGPDTTICEGTSVTLKSSGVYVSPGYLWNTGSTNAALPVTTSGSYVLGITQNGCVGRDTVNVSVIAYPVVNMPPNKTLCAGTSAVVKVPQATGVGFLWSTGSTDSAITVTTGGTYTLTATKDGCSKSSSITVVTIYPPSTVDLGHDTILCLNEAYILHANNYSDAALWNDGSRNEKLSVTESGTYWATVRNACGMSSDTINVEFAPCNIWFPNAFTPNGDGKNDIARVRGILDLYTDYSLCIYNRYGQRIFFTNNIYEGWDGTLGGIPQDTNTYFYMIHYTLRGKENMMKGDLILIR